MKLDVEIDSRSGFCNGVVRAVQQAENYLKFSHHLNSLGDIVHNSLELERLKAKGLEILSLQQASKLRNDVILIRAHGEPPGTYDLLHRNNIQIIDCTCPVVLKLQERVRMWISFSLPWEIHIRQITTATVTDSTLNGLWMKRGFPLT